MTEDHRERVLRLATQARDSDRRAGAAGPPPKPAPAAQPPALLTNCDTEGAGLPIGAIAQQLYAATGGWPRRVGGLLFVPTRAGDASQFLKDTDHLYAWAAGAIQGHPGNPVAWASGEGLVTKGEFFAYLSMTAESYEAVEPYPHQPPMPNRCYLHPQPRGGSGAALDELVGFFSPASEIDGKLLRAACLTLFWGGPCGKRPAFLVTTDEDESENKGRGVGKTTLVKLLSSLVGGYVSVRPDASGDGVKTRLLSPGASGLRVALVDNVKTLRLNSPDLEELITADVISGHRLFHGEGRAPSALTWFLTLNGASLSTDMAQRVVPLMLSRPGYSGKWEADVARFIAARRWEVIGDILEALKRPCSPPARPTRWPEWECEVLGRVGDADAVLAEVSRRRHAADDTRSEAEIVRDYLLAELRRRGHDPVSQVVWISSAQAHPLVNAATGLRMAVNSAGKLLGSLPIPELKKCDQASAKGWLWVGAKARPDAPRVPLAPPPEQPARQPWDQ